MIKFKNLIIPGVLIFLTAAVLRFANLNSLPIFADESIYIHWAQIMRAEPSLRFLPLSDGKQPLFMWAVIPLFKVFSDPLISGRILSGLCGLGTILGIFLAAQILFKRTSLSVLAAFIWAILPYSVFFERMALVDSMLTMFIVWTFVFSAMAIIHSRLDFSMLAGFTLGFAYLTKSPAIFSFILIPTLFLLADLKHKTSLQLFKIIGQTLMTYLIAFGMYNILRLGPEFHMLALRTKDYYYPFSEIIKHPWWPLLPHLTDDLSFLSYMLTPMAFALSIWGIFAEKFIHWRARLILSLWWLFPLLAQSAVAISLTARYFLFTLPFAIILLAHGLLHLKQKLRKPIVPWLLLALVLVPAFVIDYLYLFKIDSAPLPRIERAGYLEEWTAGTGIREASQIIKTYAAKGPVLVGSEGFFGTPFDALGVYLNKVQNVRIIGVGVWIDSVHEKLLNSLADNQVFLVVNSTRFHADPAKLGLKLLGSYPKAISPNGAQETLLFFQVLPRQ
jgi:4-amino-4-deoxy-L-arabinose transferase-like glycosyltransferase